MTKAVRKRPRASQPEVSTQQPIAVAAAQPRVSSPWIFNGWQDLLLFIATPLVIIPVMWLARQYFSDYKIYLFVLAVGAGGHQLPGMLRAYGDRALFERFKVRFIVAPIFLLAFCIAFSQWNLNGLAVMVLVWGFWHGLMQVYGFIRIYDAKVGSFGKLTARLDWLMCFSWFTLGLISSPGRVGDLLEEFYKAGGPFIATSAIHAAQDVWLAVTVIITVLFIWNTVRERFRGQPTSRVKLLTMATSFGFWWYSQVYIHNTFLGLAMFEIFHDVQYLSIVWFFNRKRVAGDPTVGAFTRFLFRPSHVMIGVYVALCFAYAGSIFLTNVVGKMAAINALFGIGTAMGFLHFYFDGFIWKVREKSTRAGLGLQGGSSDAPALPGQGLLGAKWRLFAAPAALGLQGGSSAALAFPDWAVHGTKWLLFVVPALFLMFAQMHDPVNPIAKYLQITDTVPSVSKFHYRLGLELKDRGENAAARQSFATALKLNPEFADAADSHLNLGRLLRSEGNAVQAADHYRRALVIDPRLADAHVGLGQLHFQSKDYAAAEADFARALELKPNSADAHFYFAKLLEKQGRIPEAIDHLKEATRLDPQSAEAQSALEKLVQRDKPATSTEL